MATPTTFPSDRQVVGVSKEITQGIAVAASATLVCDKFDPVDNVTYVPDQGMRGSMAETYDELPTGIVAQITAGGMVYADTIPWLLANILGDLTTTGASAPFSHAMALLNPATAGATAQPNSLTLTDLNGVTASTGTRAYAGAMLSSVTLKFDGEGAFTWEATAMSWPSVAGAAFAPAPSAVQAQGSWRMLVGVGGPATGGTLVPNVDSGEITITRALKAYFTANGVQTPYIIRAGKVGVTGKLRFIAKDESPLTAYLTNTQPQLQLLLANGAQWSVQADVAKGAYTAGAIDRGDEAVAFGVDFTGVANSTNAGASGGSSPAKLTVINAVAASTYQ